MDKQLFPSIKFEPLIRTRKHNEQNIKFIRLFCKILFIKSILKSLICISRKLTIKRN